MIDQAAADDGMRGGRPRARARRRGRARGCSEACLASRRSRCIRCSGREARSQRRMASCSTDPASTPSAPSIHRLAFANLGVYTFGAHCVEVDVDEATGAVEVRRAWCAHDVGRAINPVSCEGQIQGGFVQGMGYALTEAHALERRRLADDDHARRLQDPGRARRAARHPRDRAGRPRADAIRSAPRASASLRWSAPRRPSPTRSAHAAGVRLTTLPMTPERVLDALETPMKLDDYPPQEPLSAAGKAYSAECWRRSASVAVEEFAFGADPYQRVAVFRAAPPRWTRAAVLARRRLDLRLQGMDAVHGAGLHRRRRDLRVRRLPAGAAARVSRRPSMTAFAPSIGSGAMSPPTAAIRSSSSSAAIRPAATTPRCWPSTHAWLKRRRPAAQRRSRLPAHLGRVRVRRWLGPEHAAALSRHGSARAKRARVRSRGSSPRRHRFSSRTARATFRT